MGNFVVEVFLDTMPITASNFLDLCNTGYYNGLHFHRVIKDFMIQFGCPHSKDANSKNAGTGGPAGGSTFMVNGVQEKRNAGGNIKDELTQKFSNEPYTLSMANTGKKDSGGSQFFINVKHNNFLDWWRDDLSPSKHPVFGKVVSGNDIVDSISKTPTAPGDKPKTPVKLVKMTVLQQLYQKQDVCLGSSHLSTNQESYCVSH